jgi:hypothetical protein
VTVRLTDWPLVHRVLLEIKRDGAHLQARFGGGFRWLPLPATAPQLRVNARDQLAMAERLGQVVGGAELQAAHAVFSERRERSWPAPHEHIARRPRFRCAPAPRRGQRWCVRVRPARWHRSSPGACLTGCPRNGSGLNELNDRGRWRTHGTHAPCAARTRRARTLHRGGLECM